MLGLYYWDSILCHQCMPIYFGHKDLNPKKFTKVEGETPKYYTSLNHEENVEVLEYDNDNCNCGIWVILEYLRIAAEKSKVKSSEPKKFKRMI